MGQKVNPIGLRLGINRGMGFNLVCKKTRLWKIFNRRF